MAEYFSPTVFSPAVLGWDLANARFGLGTSRMPMRGKLRCSFRCTLIFFVRLVKLSCFMAARIYFQIFEQNVVSFPLARLKHQIRWTSLPMAGPRLQPSPDLPAYGRTETSNSPDLPAYGRTETSNSPDLAAYGRTVRQT